jgi:large subunit ribosomal protein L6
MSRTGNKLIEISEKIKLSINENHIMVTGPLGEIDCPKFDKLTYELSDSTLKISRADNDRASKELHGLSRTLIYNAVQGVSSGYEKHLYLQGIGYRVQLKGKDFEFSLGYSHPVVFKAPQNITFKVDGQNKFSVSGISKELVGQVCSDIKKLRKKDSYKGKGIFFIDEKIVKKPGKSIKK